MTKVRVKELKWAIFDYTNLRAGLEATTPIGRWRIFKFDEGWAWWKDANSRSRYYKTEGAALSAATKDYEYFATSCLEDTNE